MKEIVLPEFELFRNLVKYAEEKDKVAIVDVSLNQSFTYQDLIYAVGYLKDELLGGKTTLDRERIAILCPNGIHYVVSLLAIWAAGGIAVPLCTTHPLPEQLYTIQDAQATRVIGHPTFQDRLKAFPIPHQPSQIQPIPCRFRHEPSEPDALILYTSGTTGQPKGALLTHPALTAQAQNLIEAWHWTSRDILHHVLPLHHIHGILNGLICPLKIGAQIELDRFDQVERIWKRWSEGGLTVFMAVPTIYSKLLRYGKGKGGESFRFQVSGSASLPTPLRQRWFELTRQVLLERYGMTEIGMALSQPYDDRMEGTVGLPLKGVEARIMNENQEDVTDLRECPGMLQIRGPTVFKEYWNRPEATKKEFTQDGWFITGDIAQRVGEKGYYQILGRNSIDIIKTGGEKVSALEIERGLLSVDLGIVDVAVVGIPDPEWGQKVAAVVVLEEGKELDLLTMRQALKKQLAVYKVPSMLKVVSELPKNAMGKVTKKVLVNLF